MCPGCDRAAADGDVAVTGTQGDVAVVSPTVALSEHGLSAAISVNIQSMYTGEKILVTDADALTRLAESAHQIVGCDPISSRGYYGGSYSLSFDAADGETLLAFTLLPDGRGGYFLYYSYYETVGGFEYPALYTVEDPDTVNALDALCAGFFPQS